MQDKRLFIVRVHFDGKVPVAELAENHGVDRSTISRWIKRYQEGGPEALEERSRKPKTSPTSTPVEIEEEIIRWRKCLDDDGLDAGAESIYGRLIKQFDEPPSVSTIWRILKRRGFVTPQPNKRPRSSFCSFEADLPNELWQSDMTHWSLAEEIKVEIVSFLDDCSRKAMSVTAILVTKAPDVVKMFHETADEYGYPASLLTDNGCIFTARYRNGRVGLESEAQAKGVAMKHGKPYHPQTQGKVERFQQTMKRWLGKQPRAKTLQELQAQLNEFCLIYNTQRPHRSLGRKTPDEVWNTKVKAGPGDPTTSSHYRTRYDKVDKTGSVTLRYRSKLHHIGIGRAHSGRQVMLLIHDRDIRIIDLENGETLRSFDLDPTRDYQPINLDIKRT